MFITSRFKGYNLPRRNGVAELEHDQGNCKCIQILYTNNMTKITSASAVSPGKTASGRQQHTTQHVLTQPGAGQAHKTPA